MSMSDEQLKGVGDGVKKSRSLFQLIVLLILLVIMVLVLLIFRSTTNSARDVEQGLRVIKYLYNFTTLQELDDNMDRLREITTPEVYEQLTIDNTDRALNVYLKFKNNPVFVVPEMVNRSYIIYGLQTKSISSERRFAIFFEVNKQGQVSKVRESEVVDFVNTD